MLKLEKLTKQYDLEGVRIGGVRNISFDVNHGEVICVLGPSGSGKSTLLRTIAGLCDVDAGSISKDKDTTICHVPQEYALWPHLTVSENLVLAPALQNILSRETIQDNAEELLKRFGLVQYADRYPNELSVGQRQRAALLRAAIIRPDILLLDEVTSALDPELTRCVYDFVRALSAEGYTFLIATHDISFALEVADRIVFIVNGEQVCCERPEQFRENSNPTIQTFLKSVQ